MKNSVYSSDRLDLLIEEAQSYQELLQKGQVCFSVDYYSCMISGCSLYDVISILGLSSYISNLFDSKKDCNVTGLGDSFEFHYNNVSFQVPDYLIAGLPSFDCVFSKKLDKFKLDVSGQGISFLRNECGFDFSQDYQVQWYCVDTGELAAFNVTRIDFSFDLVNYRPDFLNELKCFLNENITPNGRIGVHERTSGFQVSMKTGDQDTVYIGAPKSEKLLRIYDKKRQFYDYDAGAYKVSETQYGLPDSWIRIEWQLRHSAARSYTEMSEYPEPIEIFKKIYETYNFAIGKRNQRVSADFWENLLPWHEIKTIFVYSPRPLYVDRGAKMDNAMKNLSKIEILYNSGNKRMPLHIRQYFARYIDSLYEPTRKARRRLNAFVSDYLVCVNRGIEYPSVSSFFDLSDNFVGLYIMNNRFYYKED